MQEFCHAGFSCKYLGFDYSKDLYEDDVDFCEAFEASKNLVGRDNNPWRHFILKDSLLFKNNQLYIPHYSMRDNFMQENYNGGLAWNFSVGNTLGKL